MSDEHRLLPRFRRAESLLEQERLLAAIVLELGAELPTGAAGGDPATLRGIPAVGPAVTGAILGSQPERELLRAERRGR